MKAAHHALPRAEIVHDKFHIVRELTRAVDHFRRAEHREFSREGQDDILKKSKYVWLKNPANWTDPQRARFESLKIDALPVGRAWSIQEAFQNFWSYRYAGCARMLFDRWYFWATHSRLAPIIAAARTLKRHLPGLLAYCRHPITNAAAEGLNSKIQILKANARGFRNFGNYRVAILFHCGALSLYPHGGSPNSFPGVCDRCPSITLTCGGAMPPGSDAQSFPDKCSIDLSQEMCDMQGFKSGPYTPEGFQAQNQCQAGFKANGSLKGYADKCCSARHEYAHICDPQYLPGGANPHSQCTEQFAENSEQQCENDVIASACSNPNSLTEDQKTQCNDFCSTQVDREAYKIWDSCMCGMSVSADPVTGLPAHLNSDACCGCYNSCNNPGAIKAMMPAACSQYAGWQNNLGSSPFQVGNFSTVHIDFQSVLDLWQHTA